jgi:hypothetical protein
MRNGRLKEIQFVSAADTVLSKLAETGELAFLESMRAMRA